MPKSKKKNLFKENKHEIIYNLINCGIAGGLVFLGALSTGNLTMKGFYYAIITGLIACAIKFNKYWDEEKSEYTRILNFVGA